MSQLINALEAWAENVLNISQPAEAKPEIKVEAESEQQQFRFTGSTKINHKTPRKQSSCICFKDCGIPDAANLQQAELQDMNHGAV